MKFTKSFKGATGGNPYPQDFEIGDECPDDLLDAAEALGALDEETPVDPKDVVIPADWDKLKSDDMKKLAKALGGEGIKTKADAEAQIQLMIDERNFDPSKQIIEREGKWRFAMPKHPTLVGKSFETKEAAEAALATLNAE
ncbi:hypothetical protein [Maritalea sp.]|uniref:hypothetical protein n=1 Tax=Maritalea sp. TaxID=2003361 RepID=UPI003EFA8216